MEKLNDEDEVNHPNHYKLFQIECIEAMKAMLTEEEFRGYLRGNIFKYMWRYPHKKTTVKDLEKARWYFDRLLEIEKKEEEKRSERIRY